jgi:putative addiction module component (TIGR02574 family)
MNQTLRELPIEDRLDLVEELWNSIEEDQQSLPISREHIAILDQRLEFLEQDEVLAKPTRNSLIAMKERN